MNEIDKLKVLVENLGQESDPAGTGGILIVWEPNVGGDPVQALSWSNTPCCQVDDAVGDSEQHRIPVPCAFFVGDRKMRFRDLDHRS